MNGRQRNSRSIKPSRNYRRTRALLSFGLIGFVLLLSHQNCGPADSFATAAVPNGFAVEAPMPVSIIDGSKRDAALRFPYDEVELSARADKVQIHGDCTDSQEGSILGWELYELADDGRPLAVVDEGRAKCSGRRFAIETSTAALSCGRTYKAVAQLGYGEPGEVIVHNSCR